MKPLSFLVVLASSLPLSAEEFFLLGQENVLAFATSEGILTEFKGLTPEFEIIEGVTQVTFHGDLVLDTNDDIELRGPNPIRIIVNGNFLMPFGSIIDASANPNGVPKLGGGRGGASADTSGSGLDRSPGRRRNWWSRG